MIRRAGEVLLAHYALTLLGFAVHAPHYPLANLLPDVLLLRTGHDLLPFYVVMLLLAPAMLLLLRRDLGVLLLLLSATAFLLDILAPTAFLLPLQNTDATSTFRIMRWQAFVALGLWCGWHFRGYDAWPKRRKIWLATAALWGTVLCHVLAYGGHYGLDLQTGLLFWKQILTVPEFAKYLLLCVAIFAGTDVLWPQVAGGLRWTATMGRHALPVYGAHIWLLAPITWLAGAAPLPDAGRLLWLVLGVAALWEIAVATERLQRLWKPTRHVAAPLLCGVCLGYLLVRQLT